MEDKILGFQFKTVSAKPTRPSYKFHKLRHFVLKGKARLLEYSRSGIYRSGHSQVFFKESVFKNFAIFTEKTPVLEYLFNKVPDLKVYNFIKKRH